MTLHNANLMDNELVLLAKETKTTTFTATGVDMGALAQGSVAFVNVTATDGTSPTLDVEIHGSTASDFGSYATFSAEQITDDGQYMIGLAGDYQYWRIKGTIGGTTPTFDIEAWIKPA